MISVVPEFGLFCVRIFILPGCILKLFCYNFRFAVAELDCSVALSLDPLYTKAYLRRGSARIGLKKYLEAKSDFEKVLQLEPQNKKAKSDIELIDKVIYLKLMTSQSQRIKKYLKLTIFSESVYPFTLLMKINYFIYMTSFKYICSKVESHYKLHTSFI